MNTYFAIFGIGTTELLLIFAAILLIFGGKKLPELARSIGQSVNEIKKSAGSAGQLKQEVQTQVAEVKDNFNRTDPKI